MICVHCMCCCYLNYFLIHPYRLLWSYFLQCNAWDLNQATNAQHGLMGRVVTVRLSDSHLGRRRAFRSRGAKLKPCGMTLPQLELWDRGRWAWGEIPVQYCTGVHTAVKPPLFLSNSLVKWVLQETDKCLGGSDSRGQKFWIKIMGAMKFPISAVQTAESFSLWQIA